MSVDWEWCIDHDKRVHIDRPNLPWRDDWMTECGLRSEDFSVPCDEAIAFVKERGKTRGMMVLCQTCVQTASRHSAVSNYGDLPQQPSTWANNPLGVMARHIEWAEQGSYREKRKSDYERMRDELHAIGALIEAHREDFDGYLAGVTETKSLSDRRAAKTYMENSRPRPKRL